LTFSPRRLVDVASYDGIESEMLAMIYHFDISQLTVAVGCPRKQFITNRGWIFFDGEIVVHGIVYYSVNIHKLFKANLSTFVLP